MASGLFGTYVKDIKPNEIKEIYDVYPHLTHADIAAIFGIDVQRVYVSLKRSRKDIKNLNQKI